MNKIIVVDQKDIKPPRNLFGETSEEVSKGSFWDKPGMTNTVFVRVKGSIIGQVSKSSRRNFRWHLWAKPLKIKTKQKVEPKRKVSKTSKSYSDALWAIRAASVHGSQEKEK
ncbi:MAG: hypothetical protein JJ891_06760 [Rhizobiaceae bacterium]|nr:hypothetical protein [Rhizobiaceae bacterium]